MQLHTYVVSYAYRFIWHFTTLSTQIGHVQWHRNEFESGGGPGPAQKWRAPIRREAQEKKFWSRPSTFFGSNSTISRFGERFRDGQYSLVSFLFAVFLLTVPPPRAQPFVKVRGT